jgi:hypothetical protein
MEKNTNVILRIPGSAINAISNTSCAGISDMVAPKQTTAVLRFVIPKIPACHGMDAETARYPKSANRPNDFCRAQGQCPMKIGKPA